MTQLRKVLLNMFQNVVVGYDKKADRFTGLVELPDKVINQAEADIKALIRAECEGMECVIIPEYKLYRMEQRSEFSKGYHQALRDLMERIGV